MTRRNVPAHLDSGIVVLALFFQRLVYGQCGSELVLELPLSGNPPRLPHLLLLLPCHLGRKLPGLEICPELLPAV